MPHFYKRLVAMVLMCAIVMGLVRGLPVVFPASSFGEVHYTKLTDSAYEPIMQINGEPVTAEEYASFFIYGGNYWNNMLSTYGMTWSDIWSEEEYYENINQLAQQEIMSEYVVVALMNQYNLSLTRAEIEEALEMKQSTIDSLGGEDIFQTQLANVGMNEQIFDNQLYYSYAYERLNDYLFSEGGIYCTPFEDLRAYMDENYIRAKHVLITFDTENAEELAAEVAERAANGEDFDELIAEYGEDPGVEANPDGYVFTEGDMVDEFYQGASALALNEISEPVESDYGWHVIQRLPIEDSFIETNRSTIEGLMEAYTIDDLIQDRMDALEIVTNDDMIASLNADTVHDYMPASTAASGAATDDADDDAEADDAEADDAEADDAQEEAAAE